MANARAYACNYNIEKCHHLRVEHMNIIPKSYHNVCEYLNVPYAAIIINIAANYLYIGLI